MGSSIPSELTRAASASLRLCPHKARFLSLLPGGPGSSKAQGYGPPHPVPNEDPGMGHRETVVLVHCCQRRVGLLLSIFLSKKDLTGNPEGQQVSPGDFGGPVWVPVEESYREWEEKPPTPQNENFCHGNHLLLSYRVLRKKILSLHPIGKPGNHSGGERNVKCLKFSKRELW